MARRKPLFEQIAAERTELGKKIFSRVFAPTFGVSAARTLSIYLHGAGSILKFRLFLSKDTEGVFGEPP